MIKKKILDLFKKYPDKYFSLQEIENYTRSPKASLKVVLSRMVKEQLIEGLSRGFYCKNGTRINLEQFASNLSYPSYLSLESVLSRHGVLSQIPSALTFITTRRSSSCEVSGRQIEFSHIKEPLFFGFEIKEGEPVAILEKALLDELYLISLKKRTLSLKELDLSKIDRKKLSKWLEKYPKSTRLLAKNIL